MHSADSLSWSRLKPHFNTSTGSVPIVHVWALVFLSVFSLLATEVSADEPSAISSRIYPERDTTPSTKIRLVDRHNQAVGGAEVEVFRLPRSRGLFGVANLRIWNGLSNLEGELETSLPNLESGLVIIDKEGYLPKIETSIPRPGDTLFLDDGKTLELALHRPQLESPSDLPTTVSLKACARWTLELEGLSRQRNIERCVEWPQPKADGDRELPTSTLSRAPEQKKPPTPLSLMLKGLADQPVDLEIQASGYLPWTRTLRPSAEPVNVELVPGVLLQGTVLDPDGRPVSGVRVKSGGGTETSTGEDGRFAVAVRSLPAGLEIQADGFRLSEHIFRPGSEPSSPQPWTAHLQWAEAVRFDLVTITGTTDKKIPEPTVFAEALVSASESRLQKLEIWDAQPGFGADLPGEGTYRLRVELPGHRPYLTEAFHVAYGQWAELGSLELGTGASVSGTIVDPEENIEIAGAHVRLVQQGITALQQLRRGSIPSTTSDDDGVFRLAGVDPGLFTLEIEHHDFATTSVKVELGVDEHLDLGTLDLSQGSLLAGRVTDRAGEPRANVRARLMASAEALEPIGESITGPQGRFEIPRVAPSTYRLEIWGDRLLLSQAVTVTQDSNDELDLVIGGVRWSGRVTFAQEPVEGGRLTVTATDDPGRRRGRVVVRGGGSLQTQPEVLGQSDSLRSTEVGADGYFEVDDVVPGPVIVTYSDPAGHRSHLEVAVPDRAEAWSELDFRGVDLIGKVIDGEDELGIAAQIRLFNPGGSALETLGTDPDGNFVFRNLRPDSTYTIEVQSSGYRTSLVPEVAAGGRQGLVVPLQPGDNGNLEIALRRADGSAPDGIPVTVLSEGGTPVRSSLTSPDGRLEVGSLPPGNYWVVWTDPVSGTGAEPALVEAPGQMSRTLPRGVEVELTCGDPGVCGGSPVSAMALYSAAGLEIGSYLPSLNSSMRFSADGILPLGRLAPGRYLLRALVSGKLIDTWADVTGSRAVVSLSH